MTDTNKTPNCDMHQALVSYLYGEATPEETARVESHLKQCASCEREFEGFERVRGMLQQWQLDELPIVRFEASPKRSVLDLLRELFTITPMWAKAVGAVAMAVLVLAVVGTDISIGNGGVQLHADILRRNPGQTAARPDEERFHKFRAELISHFNAMIAESEREHRDELRAQLVSLEAGLSKMQTSDLARLEARIKNQRVQLESLERDLDRREGLDVTDILFSDAGAERGPRGASGGY